MKKLLQILSGAVVGASLVVGVAAAGQPNTSECSIYQKDSTSYKSCESNINNSVRVTCVNNVYVIDNTSQQAGTGNATITGNGNGGYAVSGNAENTSGSTVTIGASCGQPAGTTTPSTPKTPTTPSVGKGAGTSAATPAAAVGQTPSAASGATLPETGSNSVVNDTIVGAIVIVGALGATQLGSMAYRRLALR